MLSKWLLAGVKEKPINILWGLLSITVILLAKYIDDETIQNSIFDIGAISCFCLLVIVIYDSLARLFFSDKLSFHWLVLMTLATLMLMVLSLYTGMREVVGLICLSILVSLVLISFKLKGDASL